MITISVIVVVTVWAFTRPDVPPSMAWGIRGGLLALNLSVPTGVLMIVQGISHVSSGVRP